MNNVDVDSLEPESGPWARRCPMRRTKSDLWVVIPIALSVLAAVAGCANLNSMSRRYSFWRFPASAVSVDAKQRLVMSSVVQGNERESIRRFCSEPPPDVFSVYASALAGNFTLQNLSGAPAPEAAAAFQSTIAEQASSLERTQTVNILREAMFRTCERYLSGAIGETEFIVQAARDQRMIVAVLAIEQLTGVQKAAATALTTSANAAGGSGSAIVALQAAETARQSARAAATQSRTTASGTKPADVNCDVAKASEDAAHKDKKTACEKADATDAIAKSADEHYASLRRVFDAGTPAKFDLAANGAAISASITQAPAMQIVADAASVSRFF